MAEHTAIAWTEHTFNPVLGCTKISEGCRNCYAEAFAKRVGWKVFGRETDRKITSPSNWKNPPKWNRHAMKEERRHRAFCGSMCDIFEDHPTVAEARSKLWPLIRETPFLDWQLLTKRADRIKENLPDDWGNGYRNVWLGVTIESNAYRERADLLRQIPAVIRFISYEPAVGPLELDLTGIDWLIYGGESGPKHRKDNPDWARLINSQCEASGTVFFFKQSAGLRPGTGIELDGAILRSFPIPRQAA